MPRKGPSEEGCAALKQTDTTEADYPGIKERFVIETSDPSINTDGRVKTLLCLKEVSNQDGTGKSVMNEIVSASPDVCISTKHYVNSISGPSIKDGKDIIFMPYAMDIRYGENERTGILITTDDVLLVREVHRALIEKFEETGSMPDAVFWLVWSSKYVSMKGLLTAYLLHEFFWEKRR